MTKSTTSRFQRKTLSPTKRAPWLKGLVIGIAIGLSLQLITLGQSFSQDTGKFTSALPASPQSLQLPYSTPVLERTGYTVAFDGRLKNPLWVYEDLTRESLTVVAKREESFTQDPDIPAAIQANLSDYKNSGFDRGHLAAAANHKCSELALQETFYLSNMSPQVPQFNRGYWSSFEKYVRDLTHEYDNVRVITGPLFLSYEENGKRYVKYQVIGRNEIAVPTHFFKVISLEKAGIERKEAYIMPNECIPREKPFSDFNIPIAKIEKLAGIVFKNKTIITK